MAKSSDEMVATMIANLKEKTGKTLDQWVRLVQKTKHAKHEEIVKFLKSEHEMGHGYANLVAQTALQGGEPAPADGDLVAAQYSGAKSGLVPIYEALVAAVKKFGTDVELAPKKAYVSLRRNKQFGLIQPSTATRLDLGVNLKGTEPTGRLEASGSFNAMVSHRVRLESPNGVDEELIGWLRKAYEQA